MIQNKSPPFGIRSDERYYMLDQNDQPVVAPDIVTWATWYEEHTGERQVAYDELPGGVIVSTVFLGINHNWMDRGPPVLWETMVFGGPHEEYQDRYSSRAAALAGHERAVELTRKKGQG